MLESELWTKVAQQEFSTSRDTHSLAIAIVNLYQDVVGDSYNLLYYECPQAWVLALGAEQLGQDETSVLLDIVNAYLACDVEFCQEGQESCLYKMEAAGIVPKLQILVQSDNLMVKSKALTIMEAFFSEEL